MGDFAVGKTSLVRRFIEGRFDDRYLSSIGVKVSRKIVELPDHPPVHLLIWDLAGGDNFSGVQSSYLQGASGALLVCDLTRKTSVEVLNPYAKRLREVNPHISLIMAGNKADLVDQRQIGDVDLEQLAKALDTTWFITSAKTGAGVEQAFEILAKRILTNV